MLVSSFNLSQLFNYTPYLFYKNGSNMSSILSVYGPCTYWLSSENPPRILGSYTRALLASQDRRHFFVTPWSWKRKFTSHPGVQLELETRARNRAKTPQAPVDMVRTYSNSKFYYKIYTGCWHTYVTIKINAINWVTAIQVSTYIPHVYLEKEPFNQIKID